MVDDYSSNYPSAQDCLRIPGYAEIIVDTATANALVGNIALSTAIGGTATENTKAERHFIILNCHYTNGENYTVTFPERQSASPLDVDAAIVTQRDTCAN